MIKISQLRAARAILGWSQEDLSSRSGVSKPTIARLELGADGDIRGYQGTRDKLTTALEIAGVIFVDENGEGPGVRLKKRHPVRTISKETDALADKVATAKLEPRPAKGHPKPVGPATDAVERMTKDIAADKRKSKTKRPHER